MSFSAALTSKTFVHNIHIKKKELNYIQILELKRIVKNEKCLKRKNLLRNRKHFLNVILILNSLIFQ